MTITPREKDNMLETLTAALRIVEALPASTPCNLCENWENNACNRWGATPPDDFQKVGCEEWIEQVPF